MLFFRFFPLKNKSDKELSKYLKEYFGFTPTDLKEYKQALIHKSVTKNKSAGIRLSNERLEFLGDAILDAIIGDYLFYKFPDSDEGVLTKARSKLVSRNHLIHLAKSTGLEKQIICDIDNESVRLTLAGNAMEAIIGAVYLRKGYKFTRKKVLKLIERFTDVEDFLSKNEDYKSLVYQWAQKRKKPLEFIAVELEEKLVFEVSLFIDGEFIAKAKGSNKKTAEQKASKVAVEILNIK